MGNRVDQKGLIYEVGGLEVNGVPVGDAQPASSVDVAAYVAGEITAGDLQTVLNALADRIKVLEDA